MTEINQPLPEPWEGPRFYVEGVLCPEGAKVGCHPWPVVLKMSNGGEITGTVLTDANMDKLLTLSGTDLFKPQRFVDLMDGAQYVGPDISKYLPA